MRNSRACGDADLVPEVEGDLEFPLLFADPGWDAMLRINNAAALTAGMPSTPMAKAIADIRAWDVSRGEPALVGGMSEKQESDALSRPASSTGTQDAEGCHQGAPAPTMATLQRVWSLWSEDSILSICSQDSVLSVGSAASFASFASIGSFASAGSIGSAMSAASLLSYQSAGSALSHQSNGSVLSSQADHALHAHRTDGTVPAGVVAAGVLTVLAVLGVIALHRARR